MTLNALAYQVMEVATEVDRAACYKLRAIEYARYYSNIPPAEFVDEFDDAKFLDGSPTTFLYAVTCGQRMLGTARLLIARSPRHPEARSEIGDLAYVPWQQLATSLDVPAEQLCMGELGKFAVATDDCDCRSVKWMLLTAVGAKAIELGLHGVLALMPPGVERAARHAGAHFEPVPGSYLNRNSLSNKKFLLRYHDYFLPSLRKSGQPVSAEMLDGLLNEALDLLVTGQPDGPKLWLISSAKLAAALR